MLVMNKLRLLIFSSSLIAAVALMTACSNRSTGLEYAPNMYEHLAFEADQANANFKDGKTAQTPPVGTTPVGYDRTGDDYPNTLEGYEAASKSLSNPLPLTVANLEEGKALYVNMCAHCHGFEGKGDGSIIKLQKFPPPPSYATGTSSRGGEMKDLTDGKIFHTITNGVNLMGPHKSQLSPEERWKIVMYVHELQKLQ